MRDTSLSRLPRSRLTRLVLLGLTLLSACAASTPAAPFGDGADPRPRGASAVAALLIARHALAVGDLDVASEAYQRLLATDPGNPDLRQRAFYTAMLAGRPEAVRMARLVPQNPFAALLLAGEDAKQGNWKNAEARFAQLPENGLMQVMRPLLMAWARAGGGHAADALALLRPLADGPRLRPVYALNAAMIADLTGNNAEAERYYRLAYAELGGANLQVARLYAGWLVRQGRRGDADKVMLGLNSADGVAIAMPTVMKTLGERVVRQATDGMAEVYVALAELLRAQDSGDAPAALLRLALSLRPGLASARLMLSELALAAHHNDQALSLLSGVSPTDPLDPVVRLRRAAVLQASGKPDAALAVLRQLSEEQPGQRVPWQAAGDLLRGEKRYAEAVKEYDRAIKLTPKPGRADWVLFYDRGIALDRSRQWPRAQADFEEALKLYPDQPYVLNYLGYSWTEQGHDLAKARQMIERAAALRPNDGAIIDSLGWLMLKQGDIATAVRHLERAAELEPTDPTITAHLGDAYWAAGRKLEAGFQWRRALTLNPDPEDVPKLEAKIRQGDAALSAPAASN